MKDNPRSIIAKWSKHKVPIKCKLLVYELILDVLINIEPTIEEVINILAIRQLSIKIQGHITKTKEKIQVKEMYNSCDYKDRSTTLSLTLLEFEVIKAVISIQFERYNKYYPLSKEEQERRQQFTGYVLPLLLKLQKKKQPRSI